MQYLLTQKEMDNLKSGKSDKISERNIALNICVEMILALTHIECNKSYCNICPLSDQFDRSYIGKEFFESLKPLEKFLDLGVIPRDLSKLICSKPRKYGK